MEPLIHYSERDPLYDTNNLSLIADNNNDLSKPEDLQTDNNVVSENVYGPPKHYIERPIYIREPEPIIEIIIKESNVTLPPPPTPPPTPAPKKKEQVQVFYVKYKKNPNGHGKDSIIYEPPIPAISPPVEDEPEEEHVSYGPPQPVVTLPPPPSTTLRTIIKPDSETYHSPSGIKVTFGKEGFDYDKRSSKLDDDKEGSAPEPAITHPQARQLPLSQPSVQRRQPVLSSNYPPPPTFRPEIIRFSSPAFRAFTSSQYRQPSNRPFSSSPSKSTQGRLVPQFQAPLTRPVQFSQGLPSFQPEYTFDAPRQPVPYQPFTYLRSQQPQQPPSPSPSPSPSPVLQPQFPPQFEFPAHHFPAQQQLPSPQQQHTFDQQLAQRQKLQQQQQQQQQQQKQQQLPQRQPQRYQPAVPTKVQQYREPTAQPQLQYTQQPTAQPQSPQPSLQPQIQYNHQRQPSGSQQPQNVVPPGGELIPSLSKYEHHTSLRVGPSQSPLLTQGEQQEQQPQKQEQQQPTPEQYKQQIEQQFAQRQQQNYYSQQNGNQNYFLRNNSPVYQSTARPSTTTERPTTQKPSTTTEKDDRALSVQLPDEVPDELRQQLLSSGILKNADISVLDYDKVGDIPLSALPPDQLANFYNAGGAQQIAGSAPVPSYLDKEGNPIKDEVDDEAAASETSEVRVPPPVEMKVVRYDPETEQGQEVQDYYVSDTATQVDPVVLDDQTYNKYLPLKVDGAEFPIPDVPELKGKSISSVVVLAPVTYSAKGQRKTRDAEVLSEEIQLVAENLKELVEHPTRENYEKFLQRENGTSSDKQAVILLVAE